MNVQIVLIILSLLEYSAFGAKILGWFVMPAKSHQSVFQPIWRELARRGHEVTVITPNPLYDPTLKNLTEINVDFTYAVFDKIQTTNVRSDQVNVLLLELQLKQIIVDAVSMTWENEGVQKVMSKPKDYFDLILIETHHPLLYGLQHKFEAPLISFSSLGICSIWDHLFGDSIHPALYGDYFNSFYGKHSFREKLDNMYAVIGSVLMNILYIFPEADKIARSYFGADMPYITEMVKRSSLIFVNKNPVFSERRPTAPNVMYFSNNPLVPREQIDDDLQRTLDSLVDGFVYFSLGTNVRFEHVDAETKKNMLDALGELPYKVLLRWDPKDAGQLPNNTIFRPWFPQQAVLAHPNVKVFVMQGGLQSAEESIANGVPMIVIPFLGDQPYNGKILQTHGVAEMIYPNLLTKDILASKILQVAQEKRYRERAQELRDIFLDQPDLGLDKIIWWCEYVIRHKGAKHLRSPSADIPLYEYFFLDVLAVFLVACIVVYKVGKFIIRGLVLIIKKNGNTSLIKKMS